MSRNLNSSKIKIKSCIFTIIMWIVALIYFYPVIMMLNFSLKSKKEFAFNNYGFPEQIQLENYSLAWDKLEMPKPFFNSLLIVGGALVLLLFVSSLASYAIARTNTKLFNGFYVFFIAGLMIPYHLIIIPLYKLMNSINLLYTYQGIILIYTAICIGFSVLILTGFIRNIPKELDESATLDGCGKWRTFYQIIFPLLKPAVASVVIINALGLWNDLLLPFLFLDNPKRTMVTSLYNFRLNQYAIDWTKLSAASFITITPILAVYLSAQKYFIKGITSGALKG